MALEINKVRGPRTSALSAIPREFVNPVTGLADYWVVAEWKAAKAKAKESGQPFKAPKLQQGTPIDVRECIENGSFMLPTEWPDKGAPTEKKKEGSGEDDLVPDMAKMKVDELKALARDADIKGFETMKKADLLAALRED